VFPDEAARPAFWRHPPLLRSESGARALHEVGTAAGIVYQTGGSPLSRRLAEQLGQEVERMLPKGRSRPKVNIQKLKPKRSFGNVAAALSMPYWGLQTTSPANHIVLLKHHVIHHLLLHFEVLIHHVLTLFQLFRSESRVISTHAMPSHHAWPTHMPSSGGVTRSATAHHALTPHTLHHSHVVLHGNPMVLK